MNTDDSVATATPTVNGWDWVRLGDHVTKVGSGLTPLGGHASYKTSGIPLIRSQNVHMNRFEPEGLAFISSEQDEAMSGSRVQAGDVLLNITGASIGRVCVVPSEMCPANVNQHVCVIRGDGSLNAEYLALYLSSPDFQDFIWNTQAGATRQALTKAIIEDFQIPFAPLAEQRRIAGRLREQLAEVAQARTAVQAQLAAAQALPAAALREVFDCSQPRDLPRCRIGDVARVQSGYAFKSEWFSVDGIRLLRNANVSQGRITWDDTARIPWDRRSEFLAFELQEGDIILSLDRPLVGGGLKLARLTGDDIPALLLQRVGRFQINGNVMPDYLYFYLQTNDFIEAITEHDQSLGVPHVSPKQVEQLELPVPPLDEQRAVAARLASELAEATQLQTSLSEKLAAINRLPAALLAQAFQGTN